MRYTDTDKLLYSMLKENTGIHFMDSGGDSGRAWQRNANKSINDFYNEPAVYLEYDIAEGETSKDLVYGISVFHFLRDRIELDEVCDTFNKKKVKDWNGDYYGVSEAGQKWLDKRFQKMGESWNTYNWESNLSQVLQGTDLVDVYTDEKYVLIQIHGGADVRGGYTDAKLFKVKENSYGVNGTLLIEDVYGTIDGKEVSNYYDGHSLTDDEGEAVPVKPDSDVKLHLAEVSL